MRRVPASSPPSTAGSRPWHRRMPEAPSRLAAPALVIASIASVIFTGYLLANHLFLLDSQLTDVAVRTRGADTVQFRYPNVGYFDGTRLRSGESQALVYRVPAVSRFATGTSISIFVRSGRRGDSLKGGVLLVRDGARTRELHLDDAEKQEFKIGWHPAAGPRNVFAVELLRTPQTTASVYVGTAPHMNFIPAIAVLLVVLALLAVALARLRGGWPTRSFIVIGIPLVVTAVFHSGAIVSNEIISGNTGKFASAAAATRSLLENGTMPEVYYRETGFVVLPFLSMLLEGGVSAVERGVVDVYPIARYTMFIWFTLSLAALSMEVRRRWCDSVALVFGLLVASFLPFVNDLYGGDADAYFIPLMMLLVAAVLRFERDGALSWTGLGVVGGVIFTMVAVKVTPAFLAPVVLLALVVARRHAGLRVRTRDLAVAAVVLAVTVPAGGFVAHSFDHPDRNIGLEGVPFQDTVMWHMLWAAYGTYDHDNQFDFTKSGGLRNERVAARTGLPAVTYLRQSKVASDVVYEPDVRHAIRQEPGYFMAVAALRGYSEGVNFYRATRGSVFDEWAEHPGIRGATSIGGEKLQEVAPELNAIRENRGWKLVPLVLLIKLTNDLIPSIVLDLVLLVFAVVGVIWSRRPAFVTLALACLAAKLLFQVGVHSVNRYLMFTNIPLLIGLAIFTVVTARVLSSCYGMVLTARHDLDGDRPTRS